VTAPAAQGKVPGDGKGKRMKMDSRITNRSAIEAFQDTQDKTTLLNRLLLTAERVSLAAYQALNQLEANPSNEGMKVLAFNAANNAVFSAKEAVNEAEKVLKFTKRAYLLAQDYERNLEAWIDYDL
jgi:hypothetical protein